MTDSIENKFKKIHVEGHQGNSKIKIRLGLHSTNIIGPVAVVECGSCSNKYKKSIFYASNEFGIDEDLECKCGNKDYIYYKNY
jgi:hypothetical protein